ncbi:MAG: plastocyanin/azurin family copper-binding protein [Solirubrobacterales bacterium]
MNARNAIALATMLSLLVVGAASAGTSRPANHEIESAARSAIQVTGREFRITLSRRTVRPGKLRVEFVNFGEDDHDLAISRKGSAYTRTMREIRPRERDVMTMTVRRGTYVFWCTLPKHKALGMRSTLRVKR